MWTTSHVNATTDKDGCGQQHMFFIATTDKDGCGQHVNATTDKDGCGQHMSMPPLTRMDVENMSMPPPTRMDVDNTCQCHHSQGWMWTTDVNTITDKDGCAVGHNG
jgi:hypothetical protein